MPPIQINAAKAVRRRRRGVRHVDDGQSVPAAAEVLPERLEAKLGRVGHFDPA